MPVPTITLDGRLVGDVQFKVTDNGTSLARFRMLCVDRRRDANGAWQDGDSFWVTVSAFGRLADHAADTLHDRDAVLVVGKLSTAEWVDETGARRSAPKVVASSLGPSIFFEPRPHGGTTVASPPQQRRPQRPAPEPAGPDPQASEETWGSVTVPDQSEYPDAVDDPWGTTSLTR